MASPASAPVFPRRPGAHEKQEESKADPSKMPEMGCGDGKRREGLRHEMPVKMHCTQFDMITVIELAKEFNFEFTLDHAWGASDYMEPIVEAGCPVIFGPIAVAKGFGESIKSISTAWWKWTSAACCARS